MASSSAPSPPADAGASWSDLPGDVLRTVATLLPSLADLLRFRYVCRTWRDAAAGCAPPLLPYLMFCPKGADGLTRCLYSLSDGGIHRVNLPEEARHWRCCGSSHGWLAMAGLDAGVRLFNPLSGARLELPPLTTLSQVLHVVTGPETDTYDGVYGRPAPEDGDCAYPWYVLDSTEGYPWRWTSKELRDELVQRVVASPVTTSDPSDCTVMVLYHDYKVAYARPGDESWTSLATWDSPWYEDLVYHENRFYLLTWECYVWAVDFAGAGRQPRMEVLAPNMVDAFIEGGVRSYLSVARPSGAVLLVCRRLRRQSHPLRTESLDVWKLELGEGGSRWIEMGSLGGCTLFLGNDCSTSVEGGGGCTADCIYFVAENFEFYNYDEKSECVLEVGRYQMKDRTTESILPAGCEEIKEHPVWISPTM